MKQLQKRSIILFIVLFTVLAILINMTVGSSIGQANLEQQELALRAQLRTLTSQVNGELSADTNLDEMIPVLEKAEEAIQERVTLVDAEGNIVFDTHEQFLDSENIKNQPEIAEVLSDMDYGSDMREGEEADSLLYFIAEPIYSSDHEVIGVLRLSKPVSELEGTAQLSRTYLLLFGVSAMVVTILFMYYWTRGIAEPLGEIKQVAQDVSSKNYASRYRGNSYKEIDELGHTINALAVNLEDQVLELERSNERLFHLVENLIVGVMLLDDSRNIQIVNPTMSETLGRDLSLEIGNSYIQFIRNPWMIEMIEAAYEKQEIQSDEIVIQNGGERILDATAIPIQLGSKESFGLIVLLYDITEIRRLEKVRTDFVANASHELRTPVTALKGFTETLLDGAMYDEEALKEFLTIMHNESERLDSIVGDILQLSKLEQRDVNINFKRINVSDVVASVFKILQQKANNKSIKLVIDEKQPVIMSYDINMLKQILLNLINNAVLYTQEGGEVTVHIDREDKDAIISVEDNGSGIALSEQKRIFERFYRVDKARSRNAGGTGLGLSIVKHLVENSQGTIRLESKYGMGSTFIVRLPLNLDK